MPCASTCELFNIPGICCIGWLASLWHFTTAAIHEIGLFRKENFRGAKTRRPANRTTHSHRAGRQCKDCPRSWLRHFTIFAWNCGRGNRIAIRKSRVWHKQTYQLDERMSAFEKKEQTCFRLPV